MTVDPALSGATRAVAERWFAALTGGDIPTALACLDADVEWINYKPVPGYNDAMPWIGTQRGPDAVLASLKVFVGVCQARDERLVTLAVDGESAAGVIAERGIVCATGLPYEIEFIQWLTVRGGKIVRWKSYTDPSSIVRAIHGDRDPAWAGADTLTARTDATIRAWLDAMVRGDGDAVVAGLADDVEMITPREQDDAIIPYVGTKSGKPAVLAMFGERSKIVETVSCEVQSVGAQDERAWASVTTRERYLPTGQEFTIQASHHFELDEAGRIRRWRSFFDPNPEVDALRAAESPALIAAVWAGNADAVRSLLADGADARARDAESGLTVLQIAAGEAKPEIVRLLLDAGADVHAADSRAGGSALHKACQGGSVEVVQMLLDAGAFVDCVAPTTGHTPLMDALWFKFPDVVELLLGRGATLNLSTHYGFSLMDHLKYELNVNTRGKELLVRSDAMVQQRLQNDRDLAAHQVLMKAVVAKDEAGVRSALAAGADVNERFPLVNGFNDGHTPLHVASRDGTPEIVALLLAAGADVNAVEPCFQAVPLHKAVYNGHADIARLLAAHPGINLDFQGGTNGYTGLHDALWHGYADCAQVLVDAGARLDLRGHDGKTPLDLATEVLGVEHPLTVAIQARIATTAAA
ncbi:MAG: ankyrin repeat domain-containing protein [Chloroflexi bacterium]|nr:ankyrin repeat domain-containing protein [Chloroflexota bacterium]